MAGVPGFEPGHDGIKIRCLTAWLYPKNGGGGRIRTAEPEGADLQSAAFSLFATPPNNGAGERSRTLDLLITSQLLYQLSYTGTIEMVEDDGLEPPTPCL